MLTTDAWLAPKIVALEEIQDFDRRYALKMAELYGFTGASAASSIQQMTAMVAMYPGLEKAMEKMKAESEKVDAQPTGLGGFLAKKMMKKGNPRPAHQPDDLDDGASRSSRRTPRRPTWLCRPATSRSDVARALERAPSPSSRGASSDRATRDPHRRR